MSNNTQPKNKNDDTAVEQPENLDDLKEVVREFKKRLDNVDHEIDLLKDDRKQLFEEYKRKLDTKTFNQALRAMKLKKNVSNKDTFDKFMEVLENEEDILD